MLDVDVKLVSTTNRWSPTKHLSINGGSIIKRSSTFRDAPGYWEENSEGWPFNVIGEYHAKDDWRDLELGELAAVNGITDGADLANTIQIFKIPNALYEAGNALAQRSLEARETIINATDCDCVVNRPLIPLLERVQEWLFSTICDPIKWTIPEIRITPRGRMSSTGYEGCGWNGLHVDHWGGSTSLQTRRSYNGSRFVINMGASTRHFIFINLRVGTILNRHLSIAPTVLETVADSARATGIVAGAFIEAFPDYPVLRVSLPPGIGYLAPTISVPHDGYLVGMNEPDIALLLPHMVGEEEQPTSTLSFKDIWAHRCGM